MTPVRLTQVVQFVHLWEFFREGILYESKYLRYSHSIDVFRRIITSLIRAGDKAWVSVAFTPDRTPVAFVAAHDCTPLHAEIREFEVSLFYFRPGHKPAMRVLQDSLDAFCRGNGISYYYLTTSSRTGSAWKVFNTAWRDLEHSNTVFKRKVV